jgi:hypothetical protein
MVAVAGFLAAAVAVNLAAKARIKRSAGVAILAIVLGGAWIAWYAASPLHGG